MRKADVPGNVGSSGTRGTLPLTKSLGLLQPHPRAESSDPPRPNPSERAVTGIHPRPESSDIFLTQSSLQECLSRRTYRRLLTCP